ncbi:EAL and HDOD domain-containing protein [Bacillus salinus]|uniref:EAL and HDOD domain-containing protein n=1 Tax=Bacillus sp. HMF5848 TaxID=2495421 RepID=UPI00163A3C60|nr:HDOD domain-containing protein [Bacillus sp. HMF5848]
MFVARQPIFTLSGEVYGYELLYRSNGVVNAFSNADENVATTDVIINSFLNIGIEKLCEGKKSFINFTEKLLSMEIPQYFSPHSLIIEILETMTITEENLEIIGQLKELGYQIALDDYNIKNRDMLRLLKYADIIKVDFLNTTLEERREIEELASQFNIKLLAEKLETDKEYRQAVEAGYKYFQGFFLSKPSMHSSRDIPQYSHTYFVIMEAFDNVDPDIDYIVRIIEQDVSLSYRLLKLINSPALKPRYEIKSIKQAVVLIGLIELRKWIFFLAIRESFLNQTVVNQEIVKESLIRAKFCELLATDISVQKHENSSYFLVGLMSLMDKIMKANFHEILSDLPLTADIKGALVGELNTYRKVLNIIEAIEKADWIKLQQAITALDVSEAWVHRAYKNSIKWSNEIKIFE